MPDRARISRQIDALVMEPLDPQQRQRAARNVRAAMTRNGNSADQIATVLSALGLDCPAGTSEQP